MFPFKTSPYRHHMKTLIVAPGKLGKNGTLLQSSMVTLHYHATLRERETVYGAYSTYRG